MRNSNSDVVNVNMAAEIIKQQMDFFESDQWRDESHTVEHLVKEILVGISVAFLAKHHDQVIDTAANTIDVKPVTSKKSQRLHGDLLVNFGSWDIKPSTWESLIEVLKKKVNEPMDNDNPHKPFHITTTDTRNILYVKLNRLRLLSTVIPKVLTMRNTYGELPSAPTESNTTSTVCMGYLSCHGNDRGCHGNSVFSLEDGRVMLITGFLNKLQKTSNVDIMPNLTSSNIRATSPHFMTLMDSLNDGIPLLNPVAMETNTTVHELFDKEYLAGLKDYQSEIAGCSIDTLVVNGEKFITDKKLSGYHRNIKSIEVMKGKAVTMPGRIAISLKDLVINMSAIRTVVIVTSQRNSFLCQQAIIVTMMLLPTHYCLVTFKVLEVGPVTCPGMVTTPTADHCIENYVASKLSDVRSACELKYGPIEDNSSLEVIVSRMAEATVKFDILGTEPRRNLKLERVGDNSELGDTRSEGVFVLYNYARLATLLKNYNEGVKKGIYPVLPVNFNEIEYSLLTNEEEWDLMLSFVMIFPSIVKEVTSMGYSQPSIMIQANGLKKVCQFLSKMCHVFSGYYSRHKILLGPEPHLLALIQARMNLALAIKQVLFNGLQLLGISPLEQL